MKQMRQWKLWILVAGLAAVAGPAGAQWDRFVEVARRVEPSVVTVNALRGVNYRALGSGVIYRADGHVVTTADVVRGAVEVEVVQFLPAAGGGRREVRWIGRVVGLDEFSGVAVVKVDAADLPAATFGDSNKVEKGAWIMVMGNSLGLASSLSLGVVSNVGVLEGQLLQISAPINPGNSGAPVFNEQGEVVGLVSTTVRSGWPGAFYAADAYGSTGASQSRPAYPDEPSWPKLPPHPPAARVVPWNGDSKAWQEQYEAAQKEYQENVKAWQEEREKLIQEYQAADLRFRQEVQEWVKTYAQPWGQGMAQGLNFALPGNTVRAIADQLIERGKVVRGYLGLETEAVSAELRAQLRLGEDQGVLVRSVQPGSPAAQGGIEQWDVILEFGQQKVPSPIMFKRLVDRARPGEKVSVGVIRAGRRKLVEVAIGESSAGVAAQNKMNLATPGRRLPPTPWLGVKVAPVSPSLRRQLGIEASLTIEVVLQNSPAEKAGLQKWDVLLEFAGEKVQSEEQLRRQVEHTTPAQRVPVVILRGGQQQTLTVEMAAQYISRWAPGYL